MQCNPIRHANCQQRTRQVQQQQQLFPEWFNSQNIQSTHTLTGTSTDKNKQNCRCQVFSCCCFRCHRCRRRCFSLFLCSKLEQFTLISCCLIIRCSAVQCNRKWQVKVGKGGERKEKGNVLCTRAPTHTLGEDNHSVLLSLSLFLSLFPSPDGKWAPGRPLGLPSCLPACLFAVRAAKTQWWHCRRKKLTSNVDVFGVWDRTTLAFRRLLFWEELVSKYIVVVVVMVVVEVQVLVVSE